VSPSEPRGAVLSGRRALAFWGLLAGLNLAAGLAVATWPERQTDLGTVRRWGREWLVDGHSPYEISNEAPDYPPYAIAFLSPLALLPDRLAPSIWALVNLCLAPIAAYLAVRWARPRDALPAVAVPVLMFLCWGGFRTLLQFSLLSTALGLLAMRLSARGSLASGLALGVALIKPQVAAPFFFWALFERRMATAAAALLTLAAGSAAFCVRAGENPVDLVGRYVRILRSFYAGDAIMVGLSELRPLAALATSNTAVVDAVAMAVGIVLLGLVCALGVKEGAGGAPVAYSAPALAAVWSLLTFYHLTYGFIVLLPAAALLLPAGHRPERGLRAWTFWILQTTLMVDVPGTWRRLGPILGLHARLDAAMPHVDRAVILFAGASMAILGWSTVTRRRPRRLAADGGDPQ